MVRSIARVTQFLAGAMTLSLFASLAVAHGQRFQSALHTSTVKNDGCYAACPEWFWMGRATSTAPRK